MFRWINSPRIRPFRDAYCAPYNPKHRYWNGLLLLLRCIIFIVFGTLNSRSTGVILIVITCICFGLTTYAWIVGVRIYKKWYVEALEASFILNLSIHSVASREALGDTTAQTGIVSTFVGIACNEFIGIIVYHAVLQLKKYRPSWRGSRAYQNKQEEPVIHHGDRVAVQTVTRSSVGLELSGLYKLREPLSFIRIMSLQEYKFEVHIILANCCLVAIAIFCSFAM